MGTKYNFKSFYSPGWHSREITFICPINLGGCGEEHQIKIGGAGELEEVENRCYFLENNPDFEEQIGAEWRENYRENWLQDTKTKVEEEIEVVDEDKPNKIVRPGCQNCSQTIHATSQALKGRYNPRFWELKREEEVMCEKCLSDNKEQMKPKKRNLFRLYQRTHKFFPYY